MKRQPHTHLNSPPPRTATVSHFHSAHHMHCPRMGSCPRCSLTGDSPSDSDLHIRNRMESKYRDPVWSPIGSTANSPTHVKGRKGKAYTSLVALHLQRMRRVLRSNTNRTK